MVEQGTFREDLFFRLNVIEINIPPLREKKIDLPLLFRHFIEQYNKELNKNVKGLSKEAEWKLLNYKYPGNIRELSNIFEYAILLCSSDVIEADNLPEEVRKYDALRHDMGGKVSAVETRPLSTDDCIEAIVGLSLRDVEERLVKATLKRNAGRRKATADMLGLSEKGLRNKLHKYKVD